MLLQIQAPRPFFVPPPDLGEAFGQIAGLIRKIIDPTGDRRRELQDFFLQNPDVAATFAAQQEAEEEKSTAAVEELTGIGAAEAPPGVPVEAPEVTGVETEVPNVLEAFGFNPEQARETLAPFRGLAETQAAETTLRREEVTFNTRIFQEAARLGTPEALAQAQAAGAVRDRAVAGLDSRRAALITPFIDQTLLDTLSSNPDKRAEAIRVQSILADPNIEALRLKAIDQMIDFQGLSLQDRLASLDAEQDALTLSMKQFQLSADINEQLVETIESIEAADDDETRRGLIDQFNRLSTMQVILEPGAAEAEFIEEEKFGPGTRLRFQVRPPDPLTLDQRQRWVTGLREIAEQSNQGTPEEAAEAYLNSPAGAWLKEQPPEIQAVFRAEAVTAHKAGQDQLFREELQTLTREDVEVILATIPPAQRAAIRGLALVGRGVGEASSAIGNVIGGIPEGIASFRQLLTVLGRKREE